MMISKLKDSVTNLIRGMIGSRNERMIKSMLPAVEKINALEPETTGMADEEFPKLTAKLRERLKQGETLDDILPEAFAACREAAKRVLGQRHYDVQLMSGIVLHEGNIVEATTGEGKTLCATLAAYVNGLAGKVHVVTVNDYLARRDAEWMGEVYKFLGLTCGCIQSPMGPGERIPEYACDITYGTNNEFGFDYLRDNMKDSVETQAQGALNFAIVDEVDSILIDEARTPLIISGGRGDTSSKYAIADSCARQLMKGQDFEIKEKESSVILSEQGIEKAQKKIGVDTFYSGANMEWPHYLEQALRAHNLFRLDKDYVVKEGEVIIVDEFTGRLQPGRRWSDGLHQAIEAKEGMKIHAESLTLARITYQHFFKLYKKLSGMTGTAITEAAEFDHIYKLDVVVVPTNKPMIRTKHPDVVYRTEKEKWRAVVEEIVRANAGGQPILVGTIAIETSEMLSEMLSRQGVKHEVLNAKNHAREAVIVADAGLQRRVTLATNMAGRGTDIVLGNGVTELGGLHIIGTERHESRRIDNQLRGRSGRQGDPGSSRFFVSLQDDLMRIFASDRVSWLLKKLGMSDGVPIESPMVSKAITNAQKKVEAHNFDIRKSLMDFDEVMDVQRKTIYGMRQQILEGRDVKKLMLGWIQNCVSGSVFNYINERENPDGPRPGELVEWLNREFDAKIYTSDIDGKDEEEIREIVFAKMAEKYDIREQEIGAEDIRIIEHFVMLETLDTKWKDHLMEMDYLRSAVSFEGYAQRDPKEVYKQQGFTIFEKMISSIEDQAAGLIFKVRINHDDMDRQKQRPDDISERHDNPLNPFAAEQARAIEASKGEGDKTIRSDGPKVGRNQPCPCGSGKKFKKCCGRA
ncbi:preprotein translocase subunit SecA [Planctomycetota bacterium]